MTFESRVTSNSVQAIFDGEVYYEFKTTAPSVALLLLQTRIVTYHPKRNPSFHGVYYVDGHTIHAVRRESDAPSGKRMMHNWLLNKQSFNIQKIVYFINMLFYAKKEKDL